MNDMRTIAGGELTADAILSDTVSIVAAFVANPNFRGDAGEISRVIAETHAALISLGKDKSDEAPTPADTQVHEPAVSVRKSTASEDHILSLIDGKPYKSLKRHLAGYGLTPAQYRDRYKLPATYPMTAPAYSRARSAMAKKIGLGRKPAADAQG